MQYPIPYNPNKFGYKFGDRVKGRSGTALHTGVDFNYGASAFADYGLEIKPIYRGEVVYAQNAGAGWGYLTVIWHPDLKVWSRYAHQSKIYVHKGQTVDLHDIIGRVGRTGTSTPHLHLDVIKMGLDKWTRYTWGWTRKKLEQYYVDPLLYIANKNVIMNDSIPEWARSDWKEAQKAGLPFPDPHKMIDLQQFQLMAKHYGLLKEVGKMPVYRANTLLLRWKRELEGNQNE